MMDDLLFSSNLQHNITTHEALIIKFTLEIRINPTKPSLGKITVHNSFHLDPIIMCYLNLCTIDIWLLYGISSCASNTLLPFFKLSIRPPFPDNHNVSLSTIQTLFPPKSVIARITSFH